MLAVDYEKGPMDFGREEIKDCVYSDEAEGIWTPDMIAALVSLELEQKGYKTKIVEGA